MKIGLREKKPVAVDVRIGGEDAKQSEHRQDSDIDEANSRPNKKLKGDLNADNHAENYVESDVKLDSIKVTAQYPESTVNVALEEGKVAEISTISSEASEPKLLDASRSLTAGSCRADKKSDELGGNACQSKREPTGSEGSLGPRKRSSGKHISEVADELLKSNGTARSNSTASYQRKATISVLKSSSSSGCIVSKSSENFMAATVQSPPIHSKQKELSDGSSVTVKDNSSADKVEHEDKCGRLKKLVKEPSRSRSLPKVSESTRLSNTSDSKRLSSDSKDSSVHSSAKATLVPNVASNRILGECDGASTMEGAENKAASAVPGKGEKFHQSGSSRGHVATSNTAPISSNIPATLSDEEVQSNNI